VLRNIPCRIGFDEQVEVAGRVVGGNGRVGAHDFFAIDGRGERNVLADGQAEDVDGSREGETVDGCVVGEDGLLLKLVLLVYIGIERFPRKARIDLPSS